MSKLSDAIKEGTTVSERYDLYGNMLEGIEYLKKAIKAFQRLGYETDTSDLEDMLDEAEETFEAIKEAIADD